jgi:hypothetical protein
VEKNNIGWTMFQEDELKRLHQHTNMYFSEIAERLGKSPAAVRWRARKIGLDTRKNWRGRVGKWNVKHQHLREDAMRFFMTHTMEETREQFGLTKSEIKSVFSIGYQDPSLKHLRKETRTHAPWSTKELKFLLRHAGLVQRTDILAWINKSRGNTNVCTIKERMQALGIASRNIQGITANQFLIMFGRMPEMYLLTSAGPPGFEWRIVPWVLMDEWVKAKKLKPTKEFKVVINTMAMFQEWIFEGNALHKMKRITKLIHSYKEVA